jgi:hypothetical protein
VAELAEELGYDSIWAGEHLSFHNPILGEGTEALRVLMSDRPASFAGRFYRLAFNPAIAERGFLEQVRRIRDVVGSGVVA